MSGRCRGWRGKYRFFGAVSTMVSFGDFLSGCLVLFASFCIVFEISIEIEIPKKGKK